MKEGFFNIFKEFWLVWVLVILSIIYRIFKPKIKGVIGEKSISIILASLSSNKYIVLNNILLKTETGTTQIDHVVVSIFGLFVIETKNYKGWIIGQERDEYWTQSIYGNRNRFKNPIRQNYGHIKAVEMLLKEYPDLPITSVIAFSNKSSIKVKSENTPVLYFTQVARYIKRESVKEVISTNTLVKIVDIIKAANIADKSARKHHVENIYDKINDTESKIAQGICPKCGGNLVKRNGKYGEFIGCSNYPKCRFIVK